MVSLIDTAPGQREIWFTLSHLAEELSRDYALSGHQSCYFDDLRAEPFHNWELRGNGNDKAILPELEIDIGIRHFVGYYELCEVFHFKSFSEPSRPKMDIEEIARLFAQRHTLGVWQEDHSGLLPWYTAKGGAYVHSLEQAQEILRNNTIDYLALGRLLRN